jgi:hypothetical protein
MPHDHDKRVHSKRRLPAEWKSRLMRPQARRVLRLYLYCRINKLPRYEDLYADGLG